MQRPSRKCEISKLGILMKMKTVFAVWFASLALIAHGADWNVIASFDAAKTDGPPKPDGAKEYADIPQTFSAPLSIEEILGRLEAPMPRLSPRAGHGDWHPLAAGFAERNMEIQSRAAGGFREI